MQATEPSLETLLEDIASIGVKKTIAKHGYTKHKWYNTLVKKWPQLQIQHPRPQGVKYDQCVHVDEDGIRCKKNPSFGVKFREYCKTHKPEGLDYVRRITRCPCGTIACFGLPDGKEYVACSKCKTPEMINLRATLCKCLKVATYGNPDEAATCCAVCKTEGMIIERTRRCECGEKQPTFGTGGTPKYCASCKPAEAERSYGHCNANKEPHKILCLSHGNSKYRGFCARCFAHLFPSDPLTAQIQTKTKEIAVISHVSSLYDGWVHDRPIFFGCCSSYRRIDLRRLIGNTMLCIEIDEAQHRGYSKEDEEIRYNALMTDFGGKFVFIRFNPDKYVDRLGNTRIPSQATRLKTLCAEIERQTTRVEREENKDLLEVVKLYFDEIPGESKV